MIHPEELLADYVDGTLERDERAGVDAHLEGCAVCREEVELARAAVSELSALEEEPVPFGVTGPVLAEAGRRFERRRAALWGRLQWAAGAAAAAALVLVVAVNLDLGGSDDAGEGAAGAGSTAATEAPGGGAALEAAPAEARLEDQRDVNYDDAGIRTLAEEAARERAMRTAGEAGATGATAADQATASGESVQFAGPDPVARCLRDSEAPLGESNATLVRLIEARFRGTPAYLAVFLESPGAGQPPDHAVVWVVSTETCQLVGGASQAI